MRISPWLVIVILVVGLPLLSWTIGLGRAALTSPAGRRRAGEFITAAEALTGRPVETLDAADRRLLRRTLKMWERESRTTGMSAASFLRDSLPSLAVAEVDLRTSRAIDVEALLFRDGSVNWRTTGPLLFGRPPVMMQDEFELELTRWQLRTGQGAWYPERAREAQAALDLERQTQDDRGRPMQVVVSGLDVVRFVKVGEDIEATLVSQGGPTKLDKLQDAVAIESAKAQLARRQLAAGQQPWFPDALSEEPI